MTSEHRPQDQQGGFETSAELRRVEPPVVASIELPPFEPEAHRSRGRPLLGIVVALVAAVVVGLVIYFLVA
jgi:hypothetical protein